MPGRRLNEVARLGALAAVAAWLLHPFATPRMYGAGDARWYANMLADFVTQLRSGIFPVFAGQSAFAFNGAVYPLRVAPLYQHLAGALDLLTFRALGFIALQHLTVVACGVAGILASYLTLCRLAPGRRWSAAALSVLYLSCPGVLGTIFTQDLYMTWMTVPLAPLAVYGIARTFRKDDGASQAWLAAPLAALWWAHSPIALWFTFIAASSQVVRLAYVRHSLRPFKRCILGAALFALLAQYPFVSVSEIHTPGADAAGVGTLGHPEKLMGFVRGAFPADLEPLSDHACALSDLQLGYGLWFVLALSAAAAVVARRRDLPVLVSSAGFLLLLVLPLAGVTGFLWEHIPAAVLRITYYWPMQRFYLIVAALLAAAGQIALDALPARKAAGAALGAALLLCCGWSLWESRQFIRAASERTGTEDSTERLMLPENLLLMDHAYGLFAAVPAYFTNGVVDPRSQARLLAIDSDQILPIPAGPLVQSGRLEGTVDANPGILDLGPALRLAFGRRYRLEFAFAREDLSGILQLEGRSLSREYPLPSSGEAMAFGSAAGNSRGLDLWTSERTGEEVRVRFIPLEPGPGGTAAYAAFGSFTLREVDPSSEPVRVDSLIPFSADVRTGVAALLETPRMFMPGYRASVDGHAAPVLRSAQGLAAVPVPPGDHTVSLWFTGPALLRLSYWASLFAWTATLVVAAVPAVRARN